MRGAGCLCAHLSPQGSPTAELVSSGRCGTGVGRKWLALLLLLLLRLVPVLFVVVVKYLARLTWL